MPYLLSPCTHLELRKHVATAIADSAVAAVVASDASGLCIRACHGEDGNAIGDIQKDGNDKHGEHEYS